jgi:hypothetical protein
MPRSIRIVAVIAAIAVTGLVLLVVVRSGGVITSWLESLSPRQLIVVRTICLFAPVVCLCLLAGVTRRRNRRRSNQRRD